MDSNTIVSFKDRMWAWFEEHAHKPHALVWLGLMAFTDAIFFPVAPELFLVALMMAQPSHWKRFLSTAVIFSAIGSICSYFIAMFVFERFGLPILEWYGLQHAFHMAQHTIGAHVFLAMAVASFTPIPDKVFIYAAGFLHAPFVPFFIGYILGRGIRMALFVFLAKIYGRQVLGLLNRYFLYVGAAIVVLGVLYGIVHWHLISLPL